VPTALLVLANALWGSSYVVAKVALEEIPPPFLAALRFILAALVLWLVTVVRLRASTHVRLPGRRDTARLLALGVIGVSISGLVGYWGLSLTTATDAALLIVGAVLFTTLLAVWITGEHVRLPRAVAFVVGIVGVVTLIVGGASDALPLAPARPLGDALIMVGLAFESAYTVLGTRLTHRYDPLVVITLANTGSCVVWLPLIVAYALQLQSNVTPPGPLAIGGVLYLALVTSAFCYLLWFSVLRRPGAGATLGALSLMAQPVVGALLGVFVLGDPVLFSTVIGGACVLVCLFLASVRGS
jgi:drug/metabolite transporter (DMT)-like permease